MSEPKELKDELLQVRVLGPQSKIYEGPAVSVSATNRVGPFDVLPGHVNFFSLLTEPSVVVNTGSQQIEVPITQGLIKVKNNLVTLFADISPNHLA